MASAPTPVTIKWGKKVIPEQITVRPGSSTNDLKIEIQSVTGVPTDRQKLLCKAGWKGVLKDDLIFGDDIPLPAPSTALTVTLIGSAESLPEPPPREKIKFIEDLSPEEAAAEETARQAAAMAEAEGNIIAFQKPPGLQRDDGKTERYQYNRLVTGLPQRQIEEILRRRREGDGQGDDSSPLLGEVAMTMGLELRRAYVNALTVLNDGTLVCGLDDGHVQLWRRTELVLDVVHDGRDGGGVDCLASLTSAGREGGVAFATAGRGCIRLWTDDGDCVVMFPSPVGTSPSSMVAVQVGGGGGGGEGSTCLAASFRVTRQSDPNQFRLVPQDEAGRQRRMMDEAREAAIQEGLARASRCVQVWSSSSGSGTGMRTTVLEPAEGMMAGPVSTLAVLPADDEGNEVTMVFGDEWGSLNVWHGAAERNDDAEAVRWQHSGTALYFRPPEHNCCVVCMESLPNNLLAVSTKGVSSGVDRGDSSGAIQIDIPKANVVSIVDVANSTLRLFLDAHRDVVQSMCSLPNGGLLTGGGKFDATVRVWESSATMGSNRADHDEGPTDSAHGQQRILTDAGEVKNVGYVFALVVLPDAKPGSQLFAVAAARYNLVKIVL